MNMRVVVLHQSRTGNTKKAAELIGGAVQSSGASVSVRSVSNIDYKELADADLIFVGTWVDGLIMFGHRPGDSGKIKKVPKLWDKNVIAFMTHALNPGNAAEQMASLLEEHGANVLATRSLNRHHLESEAPAFANEALSLINSVGATP